MTDFVVSREVDGETVGSVRGDLAIAQAEQASLDAESALQLSGVSVLCLFVCVVL
jgi:hypothetical protein